MQARVGQCTPFLGPFYAIFSILQRTVGCLGSECSSVQLVRQQFYSTMLCDRAPSAVFKYPVSRECMRYFNGTQTFAVDNANTNITEKDYENDRRCTGVTLTYSMKLNLCYPLHGNQGFKWVMDDDYLGSGSFSRVYSQMVGLLLTVMTAGGGSLF